MQNLVAKVLKRWYIPPITFDEARRGNTTAKPHISCQVCKRKRLVDGSDASSVLKSTQNGCATCLVICDIVHQFNPSLLTEDPINEIKTFIHVNLVFEAEDPIQGAGPTVSAHKRNEDLCVDIYVSSDSDVHSLSSFLRSPPTASL